MKRTWMLYLLCPVTIQRTHLKFIEWLMLGLGSPGRIAPVRTQISVDQKAGLAPAEQRLTLHNVSWETYDKLLEAFGEHRAVRFTYDQGVLEFMVPLEAHENPSDLIGVFIRTLAVESGLNIKGLASTTLRRKELVRGAEPDKCYYIKNEPLVRGRTVDLEQDPPPDLVAEIDITHTDIDKNALYAELGIPEFWRFDGQELRIYQLQEGQHQEVSLSPTFPWTPKEIFYNFLEQCKSMGEAQAQRQLGAWVQSLAVQK